MNNIHIPFRFGIGAILVLLLSLTGCHSSKPGFSSVPPATPAPAIQPAVPNQEVPQSATSPAEKPQADPTQKAPVESYQQAVEKAAKDQKDIDDDDDDDDEDDAMVTPPQVSVKKKLVTSKMIGKQLCGPFVAVGMVLLLAALVLVIVGSGAAGLVALIGGAFAFAGFIFGLMALLGR